MGTNSASYSCISGIGFLETGYLDRGFLCFFLVLASSCQNCASGYTVMVSFPRLFHSLLSKYSAIWHHIDWGTGSSVKYLYINRVSVCNNHYTSEKADILVIVLWWYEMCPAKYKPNPSMGSGHLCWKTNSSFTSTEISCILWNLWTQLLSLFWLRWIQSMPLHCISYKICFSIIPLSMPGCFRCSHSLRFSQWNHVYISVLPHNWLSIIVSFHGNSCLCILKWGNEKHWELSQKNK